jgi:hypothetical protein
MKVTTEGQRPLELGPLKNMGWLFLRTDMTAFLADGEILVVVMMFA